MLQIRLLGQFDVRLDDQRIFIPSRTGQSLLAYLALTAGTLHRREKLASIFWHETPEETAHKNLRLELWRIRKLIATGETNPVDYILAEQFTITFNPETAYWLDVKEFEKAEADLPSLTSNLSFYQGELLAGFDEDWVLPQRERLKTLFDAKMEQLVALLISAERWSAVEEQAERWLSLGKSLEPAYRALMLAYAARGDLEKVRSIYQLFMQELDEQFIGIEPSDETRALYEHLLTGAQISSRAAASASNTVTFLFTDIEGSTKLLEQLDSQYATLLAQHHEILRTAIKKWNGREVGTHGDAFFITFTNALDAIQCAADAQRAIASHAWLHERPLLVRMGLHTGESVISSTGYVGIDVHRAARIGDAAHGGQVLFSHTTREAVQQSLPQGLSIRDLGEYRLKDLKFPTPIYQLVIEGLVQDFPPPRTKFTGTEAPTPGEPPFKGLQYFDEADAELFFGREQLTAKLVNRLRDSEFLLVIIGASGSGKSSLVRAGLIPALRKGKVASDGGTPPDNQADWRVHFITPTEHPLEALAVELTREGESTAATGTFSEEMAQDPRSLNLFLARQSPKWHTLLVLDQFEELFTLCQDEFERVAFIDNLLTTLDQGNADTTLIITLRADFYAHLAQYPELRDAVANHQEYIGPMMNEELRRAIEEPARGAHWDFEPGLVDLILRDVGDEPGALPLLSHALLETWKRRAGHILTLKGYEEAGGVRGAIAQTAESVYLSLSAEEQEIARNIFLRLTELGEGTEDTRRRVTLDELVSHAKYPDKARAVLNTLAEARLVTLTEDTGEVAHEALIREWPTLREWLNQDRESLRLHRQLTKAVQDWEKAGRDPSYLMTGTRLAQYEEWRVTTNLALTEVELLYLDSSTAKRLAAEAEEQARQEREQRKTIEMQSLALSANARQNAIQNLPDIALALCVEANKIPNPPDQVQQLLFELGPAPGTRRTFEGHNDTVWHVVMSTDENLLLSASGGFSPATNFYNKMPTYLPLNTRSAPYSDNTARLWNAHTGEQIISFSGHTNTVTAVAFASNEGHAVSASADGSICIWELKSGIETKRFTQTGQVLSIAIHEQWLLASSYDFDTACSYLILWNMATGQEVRRFEGQRDVIYCVAISPDGKTALSGSGPSGPFSASSGNNDIILWDLETGAMLKQMKGHRDAVFKVVYRPHSNMALSSSGDSTLMLWDLETGQVVNTLRGHRSFAYCLAVSPDGLRAFSSSFDHLQIFWDIDRGQEMNRLYLHKGHITSAVIFAEGRRLLTASTDHAMRISDLYSADEITRISAPAGLGMWAVAVSGQVAITTGGSMELFAPQAPINPIHLWDLQTGRLLGEMGTHQNTIYDAVFLPDGKRFLSVSGDFFIPGSENVMVLRDIESGKEIRRYESPGSAYSGMALLPDRKHVAAIVFGDEIRIIEIETGKVVRSFTGSVPAFRAVGVTPDGKRLLGGSSLGILTVWDIETGEVIHQLSGHSTHIYHLAVSPDGRYAVTGSDDTTAMVWDILAGKRVMVFQQHTTRVQVVAFSPRHSWVLSGDHTGKLLLWEPHTGKVLRRFVGHRGAIWGIQFSPDGELAYSTGSDGQLIVWKVAPQPLEELVAWTYRNRMVHDFTCDERELYRIEPLCPKDDESAA
jgi:WD40 repeat protein/DNA-binding SARP family transcriptional activator